jgi:hypothetical protein
MKRARFRKAAGVWTFAIVALLLFAVPMPVYATTITVADAKDGGASDLDPVLNSQPSAGCILLENFDNVTPPVLPQGWTAINAINPDGILWQTSNSGNPTPPALSLPNAAWVNDPDAISDKYLYSPSDFIEPPHHLWTSISGIIMLWRTGLTAACWRSASTGAHSKTFLQPAASLEWVVTMAQSAPVVAIPSLVVRRGQATRVALSRLE